MLARQPGWERLRAARPGERAGRGVAAAVRGRRAGRRGRGVRALPGQAGLGVRPGTTGVVLLEDLEALDPAAHAALWRFLFEIDLTSTLRTRGRPVDEAVAASWCPTSGGAGLQMRDALHVRLVDVGAALEARTYQAPVDVVFEVEDAFCPWNAGRWRLTGRREGRVVRCGPRTRPISPCPYGSWARPIWAACRWPRWPRPGGCGSCARGALAEASVGVRVAGGARGCRTGSERQLVRGRGPARSGPGRPADPGDRPARLTGGRRAAQTRGWAAAGSAGRGTLRGRSARPAQACWQVGHQKRLRAARSAVRISPPQRWQGRPALR